VTDDPERLVAEALRAHAARTPLPEPAQPPMTGPVAGGYGLLSGAELAPLKPSTVDPPTIRTPMLANRTAQLTQPRPVAVGWVIVLALVLGLAAGAVVGLLTLL
jgi:hypothetical protein